MMNFAILFVVGVLSFIYFYLKNKLEYFSKLKIPHDRPSLLLGNLDGIGTKLHMSQNIRLLYEKYKIEHKICGFYLLHIPQLVILDLDLVKNILTKDFRFFANRGIYYDEKNDPLSANLFTIEGEKWRTLRKSITHAFSTGRMKNMYKLAQEHSKELVNLIERSSDEINLKNISSRFIADVIGSVGFGIECNTLRGENEEITEIMRMNDISDDATRAKFFFIHVFPTIAKRFNMKLTPQSVEEYFMRITKNTYEYRINNEVNRNDFMSFLMRIHRDGKVNDEIESVEKITFNELAAQSFLFFSAGFDTSSTTMQMALYELAYRPQMQDQLRNEINDVLARHKDELTYDAIAEMTFLEQIFNETIRMYNPTYVLSRVAVEDYQVPESELIIKKGTKIIIPLCAIHHDARYYYDPQTFDPSRFLPEEVNKLPSFSFLPFGEGPRTCFASRMGTLMTKLGIATIIKNFEISLPNDATYPLLIDNGNTLIASYHPLKCYFNRI